MSALYRKVTGEAGEGENRWYEQHVVIAEKKLKAIEEAREEGRLLEFCR